MIDKSAFARLHLPEVGTILRPMIDSGTAATCGMIQLEMLFSSRTPHEFSTLRTSLEVGLTIIETNQADFDRAIQVMHLLSNVGQHRSISIPDLIIGAVAERRELRIVHYDQDFERLSEVTGQRTAWVVPRGSI